MNLEQRAEAASDRVCDSIEDIREDIIWVKVMIRRENRNYLRLALRYHHLDPAVRARYQWSDCFDAFEPVRQPSRFVEDLDSCTDALLACNTDRLHNHLAANGLERGLVSIYQAIKLALAAYVRLRQLRSELRILLNDNLKDNRFEFGLATSPEKRESFVNWARHARGVRLAIESGSITDTPDEIYKLAVSIGERCIRDDPETTDTENEPTEDDGNSDTENEATEDAANTDTGNAITEDAADTDTENT